MANQTLLTLHEASQLLGVTYAHLSRAKQSLGLQPAKKVGVSLFFYKYAVKEIYLSYKAGFKGPLTLRWLPWSHADLARSLGLSVTSFYNRKDKPSFFLAKSRTSLKKYHKRYNPIILAPEARSIYGSQFNICNGFPPETRELWTELLQAATEAEGGRGQG